jgi:hypothetical protein
MSNFLFLKKNNENLFNIISEAEKLFRDEYFEQAIIQTRRFAENICKDLLQEKILPDETFDSIINRIKDRSFGNMRMKEFTDDLYFLKKHGNTSAHSSKSSKNGELALECLERAYEISIFYSNVKYGYNKKLDESVFSEEVLMTGQKSSLKPLKEKYSDEIKKSREKPLKNKPQKTKPKQSSKNKRKKKSFNFKTIIFLIILIITLGYVFLYLNK